MSAQWSDEAANLAEAAVDAWAEQWNGEPGANREAALVVLEALADAGLLVEPGSETHTEWAVLGEDARRPYVEHADDEADAWRRLRIYAHDPTAHVASRVIHTGNWTPRAAPPPGAAPVSASSAAPGVQGGVPGPTPP